MTVAIAKSAIDLGIVMRDAGAMTQFYGETLGLPKEGEIEMPGGVLMHRYQCGETVIKLLAPASTPEASNPPGGLGGGTGIRYLTISVSNLDQAEAACKAAGSNIVTACPPATLPPDCALRANSVIRGCKAVSRDRLGGDRAVHCAP